MYQDNWFTSRESLIKTLTFAPPIKINSIPLFCWLSDETLFAIQFCFDDFE